MLKKINNYIGLYKLIEEEDRIIVGLSGGADSVCLLHALSTLYQGRKVVLFAVHVHHGIREYEADRDEAFVKAFCSKLGVLFCSYHYDVRAFAKKEGLSEEEAGRKLRHMAFADASIKYKCNKVAVAHNRNDNAETLLFNLFRGSALKGLTGMEPIINMKTDSGNITIIRPLLSTSRQDIEAYLSERKLEYQEDSTNFQDTYSRNKIRNQVLTYAKEQINTNVVENINNATVHLNEAYKYIEKSINKRFEALVMETEGAYEYNTKVMEGEDIVIQKGIVRRILGDLAGSLNDIEAKHVEDVLSLGKRQVGKQINLPYGMIAIKNYDTVRLYQSLKNTDKASVKQKEAIDIMIPGKTYSNQYELIIESNVFESKKTKPIPKNSCVKWFDYDKIENTPKLRTRTTGDFIQIDSLGGRKKLKDYFIDLKIPKDERDQIPLVADGNHILWVIGHGNRISEKYKIDDKTKKILSMILTNAKEN